MTAICSNWSRFASAKESRRGYPGLLQEIIRRCRSPWFRALRPSLKGVINLRGKVIPVINMRTRFSMAAVTHDSNTRIVVMEFGQKIVGFLVDGVSEVLRIPASTVEDAPPWWRASAPNISRGWASWTTGCSFCLT